MGKREEIAQAALQWLDQDVSPVPVRIMSKVPLVRWTPWIKHRPTRPLVEFWMHKYYPCNLAIVLADGLSVLDFDKLNVYQIWKMRAPHLADSFTVKTSRGFHVYLNMMEYERKTYEFNGGELKSNGIVIVPPSIHPSGHRYAPIDESVRILGVAGYEDLYVKIEKEIHQFSGDSNRGGEGGLVSEIKKHINIAAWLSRHTKLHRNGDGTYMAVCPFHKDNNPSLQVWPDEGRCFCHSPRCAAHRKTDVIACASYLYKVTMSDAVYLLAEEL